ncbi:hypothetical protein [Streptomyces sp. 2A115]|uniref:hypothetical protein n=1 Tax=Streptomyces sp. 2A115 TaxID=3457439 RepID=UPI003FD16D97
MGPRGADERDGPARSDSEPQHAAALPDAERLNGVAEELSRQLADRQPNRTVVRSLLDSLTAGAGSVTAVLTAVTRLCSRHDSAQVTELVHVMNCHVTNRFTS